jgi:hypothetical protein
MIKREEIQLYYIKECHFRPAECGSASFILMVLAVIKILPL